MKTIMKCLLLLACFGIAACQQFAVENSGRIIGGLAARPGQLPWQATVTYRKPEGVYLCGGTLISDRWVVTAAHCTRDSSTFTIRLGGLRWRGHEEGSVEIPASLAIRSPSYDGYLKDDIALIQLDQPVSFTDRIRPATLPKKGDYVQGNAIVIVSGWGKTHDMGPASNHLYYTKLRTISNQDCLKDYYPQYIHESTLCARGFPLNGTCNGDSGGPMVTVNGNVYVGVVSFISADGCMTGRASGYVRIEYFIDWIHKITGIPRLP